MEVNLIILSGFLILGSVPEGFAQRHPEVNVTDIAHEMIRLSKGIIEANNMEPRKISNQTLKFKVNQPPVTLKLDLVNGYMVNATQMIPVGEFFGKIDGLNFVVPGKNFVDKLKVEFDYIASTPGYKDQGKLTFLLKNVYLDSKTSYQFLTQLGTVQFKLTKYEAYGPELKSANHNSSPLTDSPARNQVLLECKKKLLDWIEEEMSKGATIIMNKLKNDALPLFTKRLLDSKITVPGGAAPKQ